jgi:UDP-N-acetylglucosamine 2-epimerase (non-hydrolysing)
VRSGQHRGTLNQVLGIGRVTPDYDVDLMRPDQSLDALTANLLTEIGRVLDVDKPGWVVVQGDTASAMRARSPRTAARSRSPMSRPVYGMATFPRMAGESESQGSSARSPPPNFAPTGTAAAAVQRENVVSATVHVAGNT